MVVGPTHVWRNPHFHPVLFLHVGGNILQLPAGIAQQLLGTGAMNMGGGAPVMVVIQAPAPTPASNKRVSNTFQFFVDSFLRQKAKLAGHVMYNRLLTH